MPPKEESNFMYLVKNVETGEESELHRLASPISAAEDEELYEPLIMTCGTMTLEMDLRDFGKHSRDHVKAFYKGCNNWWKMHGKRVYRWRTFLRTIL